MRLERSYCHKAINGVDTWYGLVDITEPVDFDVCGMLNTELIKYMAELNDLVVGLLNDCTTMEMLEKRVAYFSLILNTEEELFRTGKFPTSSDEMYDATIDELIKDSESIIYYGNFGELFYQLTHLTNYGTMEEVKGDASLEDVFMELEDNHADHAV